MSKIAEQKALEAYPEIRLYEPNYDENVENREGYIKGYDQALQDFLNKACEWLQKEVVDDYIGIIWDDCIQDFKNYMEEEQ